MPLMGTSDARRQYRDAENRLWAALGVRPEETWLDLPRSGIRVRCQAVGDGTPLLFIHGGSASGTSWADLAVRLPDRRCILVDRPGTGLSDPVARPVESLDDLAALGDSLLPDLVDALALTAVDVVATSFGGWFALRGTLAAPDRVRRLVLVAWVAGAPVAALPFSLRVSFVPGLGTVLSWLPATRGTVRAIFRSLGMGQALDEGLVPDEALDAYAALLRWTPTFRNDHALGRTFLSARGVDDRIVLDNATRARLHVPVRSIWGIRDPFGGAEIARAFVDGFPDGRLVLRDAGHIPWMEDPDGIAADVRRALADG